MASRSGRAERLPALERGEQLLVDLRIAHLRCLGAHRVLGVELGAGEQRGQLLLLDLERLDARRQRIEALEVEQKELAALLASAELYAEDPVRAEAAQMRYAQIDDELLAALERWEALGAP